MQLLRGCSALLVVLAHANLLMRHERYFGRSPFQLTDSGLFGVALFFVVSGFIIALVSLGPDLSPRMGVAEFARRRFVRIVPFLWLCVLGYNVLVAAGTGAVEWTPTLRAVLVWPVGELKPNVVWSLRHEFLFYAVFALTMLGARRRLWPLALWCAAPLICWPLIRLVGTEPSFELGGWAELVRVVFLGANSGANLQFGAGLFLGLLAVRGSPLAAPRRIVLGWTVLAVVGAAAAVEWLLLPIGLPRTVAWTLLAAPAAWLAVVGTGGPAWLRRAGDALGDASFSLYLVHNAVLMVFLEGARRVPDVPPVPFFAAAVGAAVIASLLAHRFVEKPLIAALAGGCRLVPWSGPERFGRDLSGPR